MADTELVATDVGSTDDAAKQYRSRARNWMVVSAVLGLAVVGLVAWIIASGDDASTDLTAAQEQMIVTIDQYIAAWNAGDGAAADEVMDPNGYLEDVGGRWYVADGGHARYLETLHAMGFPIERSEEVAVVGNVVLMTNTYAEGSNTPSPNIYYMYPDGTKIWWVHEPYPLNVP